MEHFVGGIVGVVDPVDEASVFAAYLYAVNGDRVERVRVAVRGKFSEDRDVVPVNDERRDHRRDGLDACLRRDGLQEEVRLRVDVLFASVGVERESADRVRDESNGAPDTGDAERRRLVDDDARVYVGEESTHPACFVDVDVRIREAEGLTLLAAEEVSESH